MESNSDLTEMGEGEDYVQKNEISSKIVVNYRWCQFRLLPMSN